MKEVCRMINESAFMYLSYERDMCLRSKSSFYTHLQYLNSCSVQILFRYCTLDICKSTVRDQRKVGNSIFLNLTKTLP